ncbi:MAG: methylmalonyl Co-A mutase-associated GTPase MeaB [Bacteroidetes bacterium]|nr:methylmalonyl Co-A mutase-associated GTPase MeaB [Bacteroidota bacterium]MBU1580883.1 methylmalonyl Co-A mutase-associated GTPase MeaB [Bacteroidota bacterium]MBU2465947.1 methylmalonyl Co-A mutase-associated GTPase MeaB [Bacteroidota bacterium]MBU2557498.1 methylmalonyl Co-A mutase-associated GTPase MeaB [Bacteroidota bacterium]
MEEQKPKKDSSLKVNAGIEQPASLNTAAIERLKNRKQQLLSSQEYIEGILNGDMVLLSKAITLVESNLPAHQQTAQEIIAACLPHSGNALRLGITGVPGAGKSTFIEALGMQLCEQNQKVAVLAIDPSSQRSKGSILGDKTRMENLSAHPNAYIRPSAAAGTLGGVARKTRESIVLCEAAGFDHIFVETVGVGQSEIVVHSMVDFFLLILISGAGDELQGIKKGIMEMADGLVVNKADGDNIGRANRAKAECESALHLFPPAESGVEPRVLTCSSLNNIGIKEVWQMVTSHIDVIRNNGYLTHKRTQQAVQLMYETIDEALKNRFYDDQAVKQALPAMENAVKNQSVTAYIAAQNLLDNYFNSLK